MKRILLAALLLLLLLLLVSCDLLGRSLPQKSTEQTTAAATTASVTTASPGNGSPLPTLSALATAIKMATPTRSEVSVSSTYTAPSVRLTANLLFLHTEEADYYEYRADYLVPMEEALAAGSPIGEREGYLTLSGDVIIASSPELSNDLLAEIKTLSMRKPSFGEDFFSRCEIRGEGETVLLIGDVHDHAVPMLFDEKTEGITDLTITVTFTAKEHLPTAMTLSFTARDGAPTTYHAIYSYDLATIPEK